jgi:hypothetical protein
MAVDLSIWIVSPSHNHLMWHRLWTANKFVNWTQVINWLDREYNCRVVTHPGVRGFQLTFDSLEQKTAFLLSWS